MKLFKKHSLSLTKYGTVLIIKR